MRSAIQNDPRALENDTIWNCDPIVERNPVCPSGLDRSIVIQALREEAMQRGYREDR
jgi:succinate dehydrogenase/fumarate reductase-like Fe-S protein